MIHHTGPGLVLRRNRHMEEDMRLTIFLKETGKVSVLVKGGLKFTNKLKALLEPFTEADFQVALAPHGIYARLIGGKLLFSSQTLSKDWGRFSLASKCCEVIDALVPFRAPSPDVYDILHSTLQQLSTGSDPTQQWIHFNVRLFDSLGYGDLSKDLLVLLKPDESSPFNGSLLDWDRQTSWQNVSQASLNRCQALVDARLGAHLPWQLKSADLVEK